MTLKQVENCKKDKGWDLGNKILYDLCANNFTHDTADKILAKTWLIGRAYSVALERRRNKQGINDNFYLKTVVKVFRESILDNILKELLMNDEMSINNSFKIIDAHNYLTKLLYDITDLENRSFSSKYLHFHMPNLFFIYDTRAVAAMRFFVKKLPNNLKILADRENTDKNYSIFFYKCYLLRQTIFEKYNILLTPRQLDNFLLETPNTMSREEEK